MQDRRCVRRTEFVPASRLFASFLKTRTQGASRDVGSFAKAYPPIDSYDLPPFTVGKRDVDWPAPPIGQRLVRLVGEAYPERRGPISAGLCMQPILACLSRDQTISQSWSWPLGQRRQPLCHFGDSACPSRLDAFRLGRIESRSDRSFLQDLPLLCRN